MLRARRTRAMRDLSVLGRGVARAVIGGAGVASAAAGAAEAPGVCEVMLAAYVVVCAPLPVWRLRLRPRVGGCRADTPTGSLTRVAHTVTSPGATPRGFLRR